MAKKERKKLERERLMGGLEQWVRDSGSKVRSWKNLNIAPPSVGPGVPARLGVELRDDCVTSLLLRGPTLALLQNESGGREGGARVRVPSCTSCPSCYAQVQLTHRRYFTGLSASFLRTTTCGFVALSALLLLMLGLQHMCPRLSGGGTPPAATGGILHFRAETL